MAVTYGRQTLVSVAQVLGSLTTDAADILLYKHLGVKRDPYYKSADMTGYLKLIEAADGEA